MRPFTITGFTLLMLVLCGAGYGEARGTETPEQKLERLRWWREARFGMFIHWGPVSIKGTEISWSRGGERRGIDGTGEIPVDVYDNLFKQFNPEKFNAAEWVAVAQSAGMKYMVLTAKHCDGFCLWRSDVDDYCMSATPFGRDVCGELAAAARASGMRIGWYYSPMDWRDPDCRTARNARYLEKMRGHLRELLGNYGRIDLVWFDYDGGPIPWDQENTYALVRRMQPGAVINERLSLGPYKENDPNSIDPRADYRTPEQRVGQFDMQIPWETCMTIGTQWSWKPEDRIKTPAECIRILVGCATGDGNLLLDVGPMPDGRIEPRQVEVLKGIGDWLAKYGESIYGTRGGPFRNGTWGGSTRKGNAVYLHVARWERGGLRLPPVDARIVRTSVLTGGTALVSQTAQGILLRAPDPSRGEYETIIKLELDRPAEGIPPLGVPETGKKERGDVAVRLSAPPDPQYPANGALSLVDGMRGSTNRLDGAWLGFDSVDFDAVYSFSAPRTVGRVTLGSLQEQVSRIFFPGRIEVSVAGNDSVFRVAGVLDAGLPVEDAEIRSHEFSASFTPAPARYVRVRAVNTRVCPPWHPSHGDRAWLLIDETVIQ